VDLLAGADVGSQPRREHVEQPRALTVDDHRVDALFAAEMLVDHGFGYARAGGDLLHGRRVVAQLGEHGFGHAQQQVAPLAGGHAPLSHGATVAAAHIMRACYDLGPSTRRSSM
jgi:hypothetical protein